MKRIGIFISTYFPMIDGVINVVDNYAKRINDEEFEVVVFCPRVAEKGSNYKDNFTYKVERCKSIKFKFLDYAVPLPKLDRQFKKALKESKLDLVHIHDGFAVCKMGVKYAKKHNIPVIAFLHSQYYKDFLKRVKIKWLSKLLLKQVIKTFNKCDDCYAVNAKIAEIFYEYGVKKYPLVWKNGTDMMPIEDEKKAINEVNKKFNIPEDATVFLFVGRITELKNIFFIVKSLSLIKEKNYRMFFVGSGPDEEKLKQLIAKFNLQNNIFLLGRITDRNILTALYLRAKLFLFPSLYDASSLVQIEASSQKTPTLFLKEAATADTVTENVNGFLADNLEEAYAKKIDEILENKELYNKVSNGAYNDLYHSWNDIVKEMKDIYKTRIENFNKE